jgi:hypothetical protein
VVQVVDHLFYKREALSSNHSSTKKKRLLFGFTTKAFNKQCKGYIVMCHTMMFWPTTGHIDDSGLKRSYCLVTSQP